MSEQQLIKQLEREAELLEINRPLKAIRAYLELSRWSRYNLDQESQQKYYNEELQCS